MFSLIILGLLIFDTVLLFRILKKGSFVTVKNEVLYVPVKKQQPKKRIEEFDD